MLYFAVDIDNPEEIVKYLFLPQIIDFREIKKDGQPFL